MINGKRVKIWEKRHKTQDRNLTNSSLEAVLDFHQLPAPAPDARICEIGVGTCRMTQQLVDLGCFVIAVDCCDAALENAKKVTPHVYHVGDMHRITPICDLVIAHYVSQHCAENEFKHLLMFAPVRLGGLVSIQGSRKCGPDWMLANPRELLGVKTWLPGMDLEDADSFSIDDRNWVLRARPLLSRFQ